MTGGREVERAVDLATIPLYVRAGAVIPSGPVRQYDGEPVEGNTVLTVYPGADGSSTLYEDDGRSFAYRRGDWMRIALEWRDRARRLTLRLVRGSRMRGPVKFEVRMIGSPDTRIVSFDGKTAVALF